MLFSFTNAARTEDNIYCDKASKALSIAQNDPTFKNIESARKEARGIPTDPSLKNWREIRSYKLTAMLQVIALAHKALDALPPLPPGKRPTLNVWISGMDPADGKDPVIQKKYEDAIAENSRLYKQMDARDQVERLIEHGSEDIKEFVEYHSYDPSFKPEAEKLIKKILPNHPIKIE